MQTGRKTTLILWILQNSPNLIDETDTKYHIKSSYNIELYDDGQAKWSNYHHLICYLKKFSTADEKSKKSEEIEALWH